MAYGIMGASYPAEAGADLSTKQFYAMKLNNANQIVPITAITDMPFCILQDKPAAQGRAAEAWRSGISKMVAGAAVDEGQVIGVDNQGRGIPIVPGTATTQYTVGIARTPCANAGEIFSVEFDLRNPGRAA